MNSKKNFLVIFLIVLLGAGQACQAGMIRTFSQQCEKSLRSLKKFTSNWPNVTIGTVVLLGYAVVARPWKKPRINDPLKMWAINKDKEHKVFQLSVLHQSHEEEFEDVRIDGGPCGYHALKNSQFLLQGLRKKNMNTVTLLDSLTSLDQYCSIFHNLATWYYRNDKNRDAWWTQEDIRSAIKQEKVENYKHMSVFENMHPVVIANPGKVSKDIQQAINYKRQEEIKNFLKKMRTAMNGVQIYQHAFIINLCRYNKVGRADGNPHWISMVLDKRMKKKTSRTHFYVMNSQENSSLGYDNCYQIKTIVDKLTGPEVSTSS